MSLLPEECWSLERVPWWEPAYILHSGRSRVELGRSHDNNKVCRGHQVSRRHAVFVRTGDPEDWKTVRWSLLDDSSQGTFVNQSRIECGQSVTLNADDLIGLGCEEGSSSRQDGRETFVYKLRAPEAFLNLETFVGLDTPDSEASTPPRMDLSDLDLMDPMESNSATASTSGGAGNLSSQFSPISSEDDSSQEVREEECQPHAMDLSTSPREPEAVESETQNLIIKELAEKIKRFKAQASAGLLGGSGSSMVKIKSEINLKEEPGLCQVPAVSYGGYSQEPECITILDSDEEEDPVNDIEEPTYDDLSLSGDVRQEPPEEEDTDDEIQIISASETPLFAAIAKKIKVEYDSDQEMKDNEEETIDEACATIENSLDKIKKDELVQEVMDEVGCLRVNVLEAIEEAKLTFNCSSPSHQQIVRVLAGVNPETDSDLEEEAVVQKKMKKRREEKRRKKLSSSSSDSNSISDLLKDSHDEMSAEEGGSRGSPTPQSLSCDQPSTSAGSTKHLNAQYSTSKGEKRYKVPKKSQAQLAEERLKSFCGGGKSRLSSLRNPDEAKALRKQKLAEIARKNDKREVKVAEFKAPVGIKRNFNSKGQKLLNDLNLLQPSQPKSRREILKRSTTVVQKVRLPGKDKDPIPEENVDEISTRKEVSAVAEDKIFQETEDGYRIPKKLSISNIEYMKEEPVKRPKQKQVVSIMKTKVSLSKRSIRWKDADEFKPLVSVKYIPSENNGKRVTTNNNKDESLKKIKQKVNMNNDENMISKEDILRTILHWNPSWLEEQKQQNEPPPVHLPWELIPVTSTFSSWSEYRRIFLPLMLQELWSGISRDYEERKCQPGSSLSVSVREVYQDHGGQFLIVHCLAVVTEHQARRDFLTEGTIVQLDLSFRTNDGKRHIMPRFAFIFSQQRRRIEDKSIGEADMERIKLLKTKVAGDQVVFLTLRLRQYLPEMSQLSDNPLKLRTLSRIRPDIKKFSALLELPKCKLFESIVFPSKELVQVRLVGSNLHAIPQGLQGLSNLNQLQREIIVSVSQACVLDRDQPKISLVQGPPGTGKSSTIAGLILQILFTSMQNLNPKTMVRILVVAPSNAAVDQLSLKLLALQSELPTHLRFEMVRLGQSQSINPQVKSISYDQVVASHREAQIRQNKASDSVERDLRAKQKAAEQLLRDQVRAEQDGRMDQAAKLKRDYKEKLAQVERLSNEMKKPLNPKSRKDIERIAVEKTLAGAEVILTTLSSSNFGPLEKYLVEKVGTSKSVGAMKPVSVCIMDEASQCVEPEALMPLKFGFVKLVMVGDHEQLPATVVSRRAQELDYQQSLFSRLISSMASLAGPSPVLRLETQYRMRPEIADWPARYFYGGKLKHGAQDRKTGLNPYQVINVVGEMGQEAGSSFNKTEEKVALAVVDAVRDLNRDLNIGVITFYSKQKQNIVRQLIERKLENVVVNTVDGFQGSERDVIVMSCVRSGASIGFLKDTQRLNVALTRAKHCMVVIGDMKNLRRASNMWEEFLANARSRNLVIDVEAQRKEGELRRKFVKTLKKKST